MNSTRPICAASYPSFAAVFNCVITQGPACRTVIGCTSPFSSKTCVMPIFLPKIPVTDISSFPHHARLFPEPRTAGVMALLFEGLDFYIHTGGQVELHQRVYRLLRGFEDIDQALVRPNLK